MAKVKCLGETPKRDSSLAIIILSVRFFALNLGVGRYCGAKLSKEIASCWWVFDMVSHVWLCL